MHDSTDRIEREIFLKASGPRVWQALSHPVSFGQWFGVALEGEKFVAGTDISGYITHPGYEHLLFTASIERVEPGRLLSFRWHPYAVDPDVDYSGEPTTLVVFELEEAPGGVWLRVVESGFDAIPLARRAEAFRMNGDGWTQQMENIQRHVTQG